MSLVNSNLQNKIKQYSILVTPVLASLGVANAQVVYHDLDPDAKYIDSIAGDSYTEPHFLDLDGNGTIDVEFAAWSSVQSKNGPNMVNLAGARQMGPIGNAIMGYTNLFSASICSTPLALFCPSVLNDDDLIGPGANFWAVVNTFSMGTLIRYFKDEQPPNNFVGQWNNLNDKYMGLKFGDSNGDLHYGWIRLDVSKSPTSITVKDYAYEMQNAVAIKAGEMGNVGVSTPVLSETFNIFCTENIVNILVKDGVQHEGIATVRNMLGQTVINQLLSGDVMRIDLNPYGKGIYVVNIYSNGEHFSKKISLR